jgi:predicted flap endonuclease-1-like 5' DNA nuclease/DNA-binding transcriptional regulator YbjK
MPLYTKPAYAQYKLSSDMSNQWDSWLENQQKALSWWADMARQMSQTPAAPSPTPAAMGTEAFQDWWKKGYEQQQRLMEEMLKNGNFRQVWEQSPELLQRWAQMQQEWAQQWSKAPAGPSTVFPWTQFNGRMPAGMEAWKDMGRWAEESNRWISENIMSKLPGNMRPHLGSFMESYQTLYKYWEPLQKMIMFNLSGGEHIQQHIGLDTYREWIGKFFGMKMPADYTQWLESTKDVFDQYIRQFSELTPDPATMRAQWASSFEQLRKQGVSPVFQAVMDISELVNEGMERIFHVATPSRELEMAQSLKDIQFNYLAFLTRSAELQGMVYEAGQFALPDTIRYFYNQYMAKREMPDYQVFFKHYLDVLEEHVLESLNSSAYSALQAEVAKLGVSVKAGIDQLVELTFANQPFLMRSFADEAAQEITGLRRKVRGLEQRLADLEARLEESARKPAPAAKGEPAAAVSDAAVNGVGGPDDLTSIEGIGAKISELLYSNGIRTFQQLAQAQAKTLSEILTNAGSRYRVHDPSTWAEQASLAAQGRWEELRRWQSELKSGKR